jgi:macrolide transport system ATP-binding/permease protein
MWSDLIFRLRSLLRRTSVEKELDDELQLHLELQVEKYVKAGLAPDEARRRARIEFGGIERSREDCRDVRGTRLLEDLVQDCRYAFRTMAANKTFSVLAILSLGLGIGANTAIFSFMDAILLRSLPIPDPQSLVTLNWHTSQRNMNGMNRHDDSYDDPKGGFIGGVFAYPAFELLRKNESVLSSVFAYQGAGDLTLTVKGRAGLINGEYISGEYFHGVGISPFAGRLITLDDDRTGAPPVATMSFSVSQKYFGGPAEAVGQTVLINNTRFTVVGVTPPEFFGADPNTTADIYIPMHANVLLEHSDPYFPIPERYFDPAFDWVVIMARLQAGRTAAQAQAALSEEFLAWERSVNAESKEENLRTLVVKESAGGLDGLRRNYSKPLYLLLTLVGLILAIACANIANLLLARGSARKREMAVRLSVGADRWRVIRQLLTESVVLGMIGGAVGVAFAFWGIRFLTLLLSNGQERFTLRADLNWHVLSVVALLSLLTGLLFGLAPAIQSTRVDLVQGLKETRAGSQRPRRFRHLNLSRLLVVSQIAIALLIVVSAGLFLRTLSNLESVQIGFNRENLLTFQINARQAGHQEPEINSFYEDLRRKFEGIPGVRSATLSDAALLSGNESFTEVRVGDIPTIDTHTLNVGPGFFTTMQIPMLLGREINEHDRSGAPLVAVVNETFVKRNLGGRDPVGQHIALPRACAKCDVEIVGVSANALYGDLKSDVPSIVYLPYAQGVFGIVEAMVYELRTAGNPLVHVDTVREIVRRADERIPLSEVKTQRAVIDQTINQEIAFARLCSAFAILALTIACVGLYGTMSYNVARRTGEIGIRMALGAQRSSVIWMVLREVLLMATVGLAIGLPASLAASTVVKSFLFGMKPNDALSLIGAVLVLTAAMVLAGYLPARRASRIDPLVALRHE